MPETEMATPRTLLDKIWDDHVIADLGDGMDLLHVDRTMLHDLSGGRALSDLEAAGHTIRNPELVFATPDHAVSTAPNRRDDSNDVGARLIPLLRDLSRKRGIEFFDIDDPRHGIVHVIGPELGLTLPGATLVCGDSHTCTNGGLGALAWGIGSSELAHALVTQTIVERRPKRLRVRFDGVTGTGVEAKDMILHVIGRIGTAAGTGHAVEYAGTAIDAMDVEGRMTICNLSIELGAKMGLIAPDDVTFAYLADKPMAPKGAMWEQAVAYWSALRSDGDARFDREVTIDAANIAPQITWGTSPEHTIAVGEAIPDPGVQPDENRRAAMTSALDYMDLTPGQPLTGLRIDRVFIGSCTNSRLSDLRRAAAVARGRHVADHVTAWVVPGSYAVKRAAEAEGLDRVFTEAGFDWREPGCSMCVAANGETVAPGQRCVSTSNRNFVGRQGPNARTHLAGPAMATAAAVSGEIVDVRALEPIVKA